MTYLDEAFEAITQARGGAVAGWLSTAKIIELAEPFVRRQERAKLEAQLRKDIADRRLEAARYKAQGDTDLAVQYDRSANAVENATNAALASHPTPDEEPCEKCGDDGEIRPRSFRERQEVGLTVPCPDCTPDTPASPVPQDPALECCCGHTAHWHGQESGAPEGSGECEFHGDCGCKRFLLRRPLDGSKTASPVLGDEERERLTHIADGLERLAAQDDEFFSRTIRERDAAFLRKLAQGEERDG